MNQHVRTGGISVAQELHEFIENEVLPGTGIEEVAFWSALERLVHTFGPRNRELLGVRSRLQSQLDNWHLQNRDHDPQSYEAFLREIGYLVPDGDDFQVTTDHVDPEIASVAGPQLVVPVSNERFAINAANARWGSLYDAYYGTDVMGDRPASPTFNEQRAKRVIAAGRAFLDQYVPLKSGSYSEATGFSCTDGALTVHLSGDTTELRVPTQFAGFSGKPATPNALLLHNNGLHIEVKIDADNRIGKIDDAGVADIILEAALTTICDLEDSIAAIDATDKVAAYRNWLGLMKGTLSADFSKGGETVSRRLNAERTFSGPDGSPMTLPGRSLLLVRNVGHLMEDACVLDRDGNPAMEGIVDGLVTSLISLHDLRRNGPLVNSSTGAIYIVKPKMHGPDEVSFANDLFDAIEDALGLARHTIKIGVMDEERRTSVNLKECIRAVKDRIFFINTGFLDRTGDEIRTSMHAGAMLPKGAIKDTPWIKAYEDRNVDIGLKCGLPGHAQIGKGMWAMPDEMAHMMVEKVSHPKAGADTAWVPSPTAATLHAIHYHDVNVRAVQSELATRQTAPLSDLLTIPLAQRINWSADEIAKELENNAQSILGYVVRWIDQGIGCSKVPDIDDVGLMEDRATLRISSQHMANWLHHGICSKEQVLETMQRMAVVVDRQNSGDPSYRPMAPKFEDSVAFAAACDLVFQGIDQPNGYTEPVLHARRAEAKSVQSAT